MKYKEPHFLDLYRKFKKVFVKPKIHWYFGPWQEELNLPAWRSGPVIVFGKGGEYIDEWNHGSLVTSHWSDYGKKKHPILSRIIKPVYQLPRWLSFYIFNHDMTWKTKWGESDFNYEYPPHLTIVFFNYAISVTAYIPKEYDKDFTCEYDYWESMLTYEYCNGDLKKANDIMGFYGDVWSDDFRFRFNPNFLRDPKMKKELSDIQMQALLELYNQPIPIYFIALDTMIKDVETNEVEHYITTYNDQMLLFDSEDSVNDAIKMLKPIKVHIGKREKEVSYGILYYEFKDKDEFNEEMPKKLTKPLYKSAVTNKALYLMLDV